MVLSCPSKVVFLLAQNIFFLALKLLEEEVMEEYSIPLITLTFTHYKKISHRNCLVDDCLGNFHVKENLKEC